ncbi:MAG TPA: TIGR02757 family protein [Candidatus Polarisedimenticolaceae bacterium]
MRRCFHDDLPRRLTALAATCRRGFLDTDPVGLVRRFDDPSDREIAGIVASGLAYGRVASIRASVERVLEATGSSPGRFVDAFDERRDARRLDGFVHRFTRGADLARLFLLIRRARTRAGSLEAFFLEGDPEPGGETYEGAMRAFVDRLFALDSREDDASRGARWLFPSPESGSLCKRPCLFLRWMVRPDDGVDCGVWSRASRARLVAPLDTHLVRVAALLGWTRRKSPGWPMALEVTARLRALDPSDPIRFDFALSRLGILGLLPAPGGRLARRHLERAFDLLAAGEPS